LIREEQKHTEELEGAMIFALMGDFDRLPEFGLIERVPSPKRRYGNCAENREPSSQNRLITRRRLAAPGWVPGHLGIPHATIHRRSAGYAMDFLWRPWYNPRKGRESEVSSEDGEMLRMAPLSDPLIIHKEVDASHVMQIMRDT
jgi:hypothetical protein